MNTLELVFVGGPFCKNNDKPLYFLRVLLTFLAPAQRSWTFFAHFFYDFFRLFASRWFCLLHVPCDRSAYRHGYACAAALCTKVWQLPRPEHVLSIRHDFRACFLLTKGTQYNGTSVKMWPHQTLWKESRRRKGKVSKLEKGLMLKNVNTSAPRRR